MKKALLSFALITIMFIAGATEKPLWLRYTAISPNGENIAFTYKGDIFIVSPNGGQAKQLTTNSSYDVRPVWSNDSKTIAFMSDREGSFDIFTIPADGGTAKRVTFNSSYETPYAFTNDNKNILFNAYYQKSAKNSSYPKGGELYMVDINGGRPVQILENYAGEASISKDGKYIVYEEKNVDNKYRKHHTSSASRDIWLYDTTTKKHKIIFDYKGEDTDPTFNGDGSKIYFLSERNGSSNIFVAPTNNTKNVSQITNLKNTPIRHLSVADNGTLCFNYDGEIYTLKEGNSIEKVNLTIKADFPKEIKHLKKYSGGYNATVSEDGKQVAFVYRGNIFVTATDYSTTKQITDSPDAENNPSFSPDGKTLVYSSERGNFVNLYTATITRSEEPYFSNATLISEKPLFNDNIERAIPKISPDGKKIAYVKNRRELWVCDIDGTNEKQINNGDTHPDFSGYYVFSWSPDSKWLAIEHCPFTRNPYSDVAIINVASTEIISLTESAYFNSNPRWVMNGNAILHTSNRFGMRNHASWGSEDDVMITFLNKKSYDEYRKSNEDIELSELIESEQKTETPKKDKKKNKKDSKEEKKDSNDIIIERDGLKDRTIRLTKHSSFISDAIVTNDCKELYYISSYQEGRAMWKVDLKEGSTSLVQKVPYASIDTDKDMKHLFLFGSKFYKIGLGESSKKSIDYVVEMDLDNAKEREYMLKHVGIEEGRRFYNKNMHGVNWDSLVNSNKRFLPHINNNYDFADMLSEMLGELNVSHTGSGYSNPKSYIYTASLGLIYDSNYKGDGLKVSEIIEGSPFDNSTSKLKVGDIITAINGHVIKAEKEYDTILEGIAYKKTLITFKSGKKSIEEVIYPISKGRTHSLLYKRWVKERERIVDSLSNGRLGYVHIDGMDDSEFRKAYSKVLGRYNKKDGIIIDIRYNGGGRLHEDIEILFSGEHYLTQVVRGVEYCTMPSRRSTLPSVMLVNENCYSNAHGTPWVYRYKKMGKLVGMPVAGTMTSVSWETLQDETLYFGIPEVGYRTKEGTYLENSEIIPDIIVRNTPESLREGKDLQLETAVKSLLKDIDK